MKTVSQAKALAAATEKMNGSADAILTAAVNADKARGKLAEQVRALFASPVTVVSATLSAVFTGIEARVTRKGEADAEAWGRIANSIATNVRIQWNALPEASRPQVCYIALDRGAMRANVQVLDKPNKSELKAAIGHDQKAFNATAERLFGKKPAKPEPKGEADAPKVVVAPDSHAPTGGVIGAIMEQTRALSVADLQKLVAELNTAIAAREEARLQADEKKGRGAGAAGKPNAKARGESQRVAKNQPSKPSRASAAPSAPTTETGIAAGATPGAVLKKGRNEAAPSFKPTDAEPVAA